MRCAIYCRLSKEDKEKQEESESIQNQKQLLLQYAQQMGWDIYQIYSDEDYSGIDRQRPAFQQLLKDAQAQKFSILLCKTQSRFTRDMELVEKYLHYYFPLWGIRFISLLDHGDTQIYGNKKARQINGLINEWYLEDLSENIRAVLDYKRKNGQYIASFPLYGYQKAPQDKHNMIIDEPAAAVVKQIFAYAGQGYGKAAIARILNEKGIPNPSKYKQLQGYQYQNNGTNNPLGLWNKNTIGRILQNEMYIGTLVQGKRKKVNFKSKQCLELPSDCWIKIPNHHPPIIEQDEFWALQKEKPASAPIKGEIYALAGLVKCADCKSTCIRTSSTDRNCKREYLRCKNYAAAPKMHYCSSHSIPLSALQQIVCQKLLQYCQPIFSASIENTAQIHPALPQAQASEPAQIFPDKQQLEQQIQLWQKALQQLYYDRAQELISEPDFHFLLQQIQKEKKKIQTLQHKKTQKQTPALPKEKTQQQLRQLYQELQNNQLPRALAQLCIASIEIGETQGGKQMIQIHWLF